MRKFLGRASILATLFFAMVLTLTVTAFAAEGKLVIWNHSEDSSLLNRTLEVNRTSAKDVGFKLTGATERSHRWSSSNASIMLIDSNDAVVSIKGEKEGFAKLNLSVTDTSGNSYKDFVNVSVYTPLKQDIPAVTKNGATLRRSATMSDEKKNIRKVEKQGVKLTIVGTCGDFYRIRSLNGGPSDSFQSEYSYVKKSELDIPVTKVTITERDLSIAVSHYSTLAKKIEPEVATDKTLTWTSSKSNVATVNKNGTIGAKKQGYSKITAAAASGAKDSMMVSVYEPRKALKAATKSGAVLQNGAYPASANTPIRRLAEGKGLSVIGESGNYYYVIEDNTYGYILKSKVEILVTKIVIGEKTIRVNKKTSRKIKYTVYPIEATEEVYLSSSDSKVASVKKSGIVKTHKKGKANIRATSRSGNASSILYITVTIPGKKTKFSKPVTVKEGDDKPDKMQGLCGIGKTIYFIKIKKDRTGPRGKAVSAMLYTAKVKKSGKSYKVVNPKPIKELKGLGHANSMTAISHKGYHELYIAPMDRNSGKLKRIRLNKSNSTSGIKVENVYLVSEVKGTVKRNGIVTQDTQQLPIAFICSSVTHFIKKGKPYFILSDGSNNYVGELNDKRSKIICKSVFYTSNSIGVKGAPARSQGRYFCKGTDYYCVYSFAYPSDFINKYAYYKCRGTSIVHKYKLKINGDSITVNGAPIVKRFDGGKAVKWKDKKKKVKKGVVAVGINKKTGRTVKTKTSVNAAPKFEMEELYYYKGRFFFNSEGGNDCYDLLARF